MKHVISICFNIVIFTVICSDSVEGFGFGADWSWDFLWDKLDHLKKYEYGGTRGGGRLWQRSVNRGGQRRGWGRSRSGGGNGEDDSEELLQNIYMNNGRRRYVNYDREMDSKSRTPPRRFYNGRDFDARSSSSGDVEEEEILGDEAPNIGGSENKGSMDNVQEEGANSPSGVEPDEVPSNPDTNSGNDPPDVPSPSNDGSNTKPDTEEQEVENKPKEGSKNTETEGSKNTETEGSKNKATEKPKVVKSQSVTPAPGNMSQTTERSEAGEFANGTSIGRTDVPEEIEPEDPVTKTTRSMLKLTTKATPPEVEVEAEGQTTKPKKAQKPKQSVKQAKQAEIEKEMEAEHEPVVTKKQTTASPATQAPINKVNVDNEVIGDTKPVIDSTKLTNNFVTEPTNIFVTQQPKFQPKIPLPPPNRSRGRRPFLPRVFFKTTMRPSIPVPPKFVSKISNTQVTIGDSQAKSISDKSSKHKTHLVNVMDETKTVISDSGKASKIEAPLVHVGDRVTQVISDADKSSKFETPLVHVVDGSKPIIPESKAQGPPITAQTKSNQGTQNDLNTIKSLISQHTGGSTIVRDFIGLSDNSQNRINNNVLPTNEKAVLSLGNKDLMALMNEMANSVKTSLSNPANSKANTAATEEITALNQVDVLPTGGSISSGAETAVAPRAQLPMNGMSLGSLDTSQNAFAVSPSKKPSLIMDKIRPTLGLDFMQHRNVTLFNIADIKKGTVSNKKDLPVINKGASVSPFLEKSFHNSMNSVAIGQNVPLPGGNVITQNKENHWQSLANSGLGRGLGTRRRGPGVWLGGRGSKVGSGSKLMIGSSLNNSWMASARADARKMAAKMGGQWKSKNNV